MYSGTVDITKGQGAGKIFLLRFRYIEVLFHIFNYCEGEGNFSLFRGLRYIEVRYFEVS